MPPTELAALKQDQAELAAEIKRTQNWLSSRVPGLAAQPTQPPQPLGDAIAAALKLRKAGGQ